VGNTREVSANLKRLARQYEWSVSCLKYEARKRGWRSRAEYRPWTSEEEVYLSERIGTTSLGTIAKHLKRSLAAVTVRANRLHLSARLADGYNISTLCEVFGTDHRRVGSWIRRGLFGKPHGHGGRGGEIWLAESDVIRFIRKHPSEYDLGRVDQVWFKAMVFAPVTSLSGDVR
jgi:hypothetical protein